MLTERNRLVFEAAVEFAVVGSPGNPVPYLGDAVAAAEALAQRVFGPEGATSETEVAPSASEPIRRGDLVTIGAHSETYRVIEVPPTGNVLLRSERSGLAYQTQRDELRPVRPLVCPGHKVDLATRKCVHCGLTDKAIVAAGQTWSAAEGTAEPVHMSTGTTVGAAATSEVKKLPGWANDVYQAILRARAEGRIASIRVQVDNNHDPAPFQLVVSVRDFLATFGLEGESRD
jgi:hypothetical protein